MGCCDITRDLHMIVVPAKQAIVADIERLLSAVRGDVRRELHLETTPGLTLLLPRLNLGDVDPIQGQGERAGQIGPHRIACEVDQMQIIPRGFLGLSSESGDRKSTRLNSSHGYISYAVFCLKKKKKKTIEKM